MGGRLHQTRRPCRVGMRGSQMATPLSRSVRIDDGARLDVDDRRRKKGLRPVLLHVFDAGREHLVVRQREGQLRR